MKDIWKRSRPFLGTESWDKEQAKGRHMKKTKKSG
jgi:hypothetical protein